MTFWTPRRILTILAPLYIAVAFGLSSCGKLMTQVFGHFHEGLEIPYPVTPDDTLRAHNVQVCLQTWARAYFGDRASSHFNDSLSQVTYTEPATGLVIMRVDGDGVISVSPDGTERQVDAAERGDTMLISHWITPGSSKWVSLLYHEAAHRPQSNGHRELIGSNGDIHWAPPWDYCHIVRYTLA